MKTFIFAIGGTGARVLRSLSFLMAGNIDVKGEVIPIIIDMDERNGDLSRTESLLSDYKDISNIFQNTTDGRDLFFKNKFKLLKEVLSEGDSGTLTSNNFKVSFGNINNSFSDYLRYNDLMDEDKALLDCLYNNDLEGTFQELNLELSKGFKGNPNIGSVVFNELFLSQEFKCFERAFLPGDRIFIVSSIFGGTGASGFPALLKNLRNSKNEHVKNAPIGSLIIKPYFKVNVDNTSSIDSDTFLDKSKAALTYYFSSVSTDINRTYYLGDNQAKVYENREGGPDQKNDAHFIELVGAQSVIEFINSSDDDLSGHEAFEYGLNEQNGVFKLNPIRIEDLFDFDNYDGLVRLAIMMKFVQDEIGKNPEAAFLKNLEYDSLQKNDKIIKLIGFLNKFKDYLRELGKNDRSFMPFYLDAGIQDFINGHQIKELGTTKNFFGGRNNLFINSLNEYSPDERLSNEENLMQAFSKTFINDLDQELYYRTRENSGSKVLRLHSTGQSNLKGWEKSRVLTPNDISTINSVIKQGQVDQYSSSIPTPFARLHMMDEAFGNIANSRKFVGATVHHQLVSDCLDIFQLIYEKYNDGNIIFKKWDKTERLGGLHAKNGRHALLADTIDMYYPDNVDYNQIYFIYYVTTNLEGYKEKTLIGGTSPFTGYFLSPNWKRNLAEKGYEFKAANGDIHFDDLPYSLEQRVQDFVLFMYKLFYANRDSFSQNFRDYFDNLRTSDNDLNLMLQNAEVNNSYTTAQLQDDYVAIVDPVNSSAFVSCNGAILCTKSNKAPVLQIEKTSSFTINNSQSHFKNYRDNTNKVIDKMGTPLVLQHGQHGGPNAVYFQNVKWNPLTPVTNPGDLLRLGERRLPGANIDYPYLTKGDFFEDTLIELPYNVDTEKFYLGKNENGQSISKSNYLLPLKKIYFSFFGLSDLEKQLTVAESSDSNGRVLTFTLKIPIGQVGYSMKFVQKFNSENIRSFRETNFNLAIFPFYKTNGGQNKYKIGAYSLGCSYDLKAYKFQDVINPTDVVNSSPILRSRTGTNSQYFDIDDTFDLIEVDLQTSAGLVLPLMKSIDSLVNINKYNFAIDFGTSNTHVSMDLGGQNGQIKSFEIKEDYQLVTLNEIQESDGTYTFYDNFKTALNSFPSSYGLINREFVPPRIAEGEEVSFPIRTCTVEHQTYKHREAKIFSNMNIGFNLESDGSVLQENKYVTNIKWGITSNDKSVRDSTKDRISTFFHELLWLIKNKISLNKGVFDISIHWMYPMSMDVNSKSALRNAYREECIKVFFNNEKPQISQSEGQLEIKSQNGTILLVEHLESTVPYFMLEDKWPGTSVLNIDIGGGTTDIFYFTPADNHNYASSFRFAGNDLWGDGPILNGSKNNGFLAVKNQEISEGKTIVNGSDRSDVLHAIYKSLHGNTFMGSEDVISFLFRNDDFFDFTDTIRLNHKLWLVPFIHLNALIYHTCRVVKDSGLEMPTVISFTGKGSSYINILTDDFTAKTNLLKDLFKIYFEVDELPFKFQISMSDNPKQITAEGALKKKYSRENVEGNIEMLVHHGGEEPFKKVVGGDIETVSESSNAEFESFLKVLNSEEINEVLEGFNKSFRLDDINVIDYLKTVSQHSYKAERFSHVIDKTKKLPETTFFWYLKSGLYELCKELAK